MFDEEFLLNALLVLCGSDELNDEINREILLRIVPNLALIYAAPHRKLISLRCIMSDTVSYMLLLQMAYFFSSFSFYLFVICKC